jgi:hypothetical protein
MAMLLATSSTARAADPRAEAKADLVAGLGLLDKGDNEGALRKFEAAFALVPSPKVQFDMGLALQGLDRNVQALEAFDRFLEGATDVPQEKRDQAERHRRELLAKVASIAVSADDAGVDVAIDGVSRGKTPLARPVYVDPGLHRLTAQKPGLAPVSQSFAATKGAALTIPIVFGGAQKIAPGSQAVPTPGTPTPPAAQAPPPVLPTPPMSSIPPSAPPMATASTPEAPARTSGGEGLSLRQKVGWGLGIGAGAVLVGAVIETVVWQAKRSDFNNNAGCGELQLNHGAAGCNGLFDSISQAQTLSIIGYVVAGALAGGSAVLILTGKRLESTQSAVACTAGFGRSLMTCRLSF